MTQPQTTEQPVIQTPQELGMQLRMHREKKGLSIGEVSERLKLPTRQIEALETGDYDLLPETVFVRGFLRSYGRFLDVDDQLLTQAVEKIAPQKQARYAPQNTSLADRKEGKSFPTWIFGVLAAIGIGYGVFVWQNKSQTEHSKQEAESAVLSASNPLAASSASIKNANVIVKPMEASMAESASAASATGVAGELVINTRYRTMLTVTNAKGEVLINQIVPSRSEHRFTEGAPFEVRIGYASGATAVFNGQEINVNAARKGGKTAVFTAGETP